MLFKLSHISPGSSSQESRPILLLLFVSLLIISMRSGWVHSNSVHTQDAILPGRMLAILELKPFFYG